MKVYPKCTKLAMEIQASLQTCRILFKLHKIKSCDMLFFTYESNSKTSFEFKHIDTFKNAPTGIKESIAAFDILRLNNNLGDNKNCFFVWDMRTVAGIEFSISHLMVKSTERLGLEFDHINLEKLYGLVEGGSMNTIKYQRFHKELQGLNHICRVLFDINKIKKADLLQFSFDDSYFDFSYLGKYADCTTDYKKSLKIKDSMLAKTESKNDEIVFFIWDMRTFTSNKFSLKTVIAETEKFLKFPLEVIDPYYLYTLESTNTDEIAIPLNLHEEVMALVNGAELYFSFNGIETFNASVYQVNNLANGHYNFDLLGILENIPTTPASSQKAYKSFLDARGLDLTDCFMLWNIGDLSADQYEQVVHLAKELADQDFQFLSPDNLLKPKPAKRNKKVPLGYDFSEIIDI